MAVEYLKEGSTSFTSTSWITVAGAGGSGVVNTAELVCSTGGASVTADLSYSGVSIRYLKLAERFSGNIGTAAVPLIVDIDDPDTEWSSSAATSGRIEHYGPGTLFVNAGGGNTKCSNLFQFGVGRTVMINGIFANVQVKNGSLQVEEAATLTKADLFGGSATIVKKSSQATTINVHGGNHTLQRPCTTINVYGGTLNLNVFYAQQASNLNIYGGTVNLLGHGDSGGVGVITACTQYGGFLDVTSLRVDTTITTLTRYANARISAKPMGAMLTVTNDIRKDPTIQAYS